MRVSICAGIGFALATVSLFASCSVSAPSAPLPTFNKDVAPILQARCQGCHVEGGIAPFTLGTYARAKAHAIDIVAQTTARTMPPWGATDTAECSPRFKWKHDARLSDAEIKTLSDWHAGGMLEGDAKDAPAPLPPPARGLPGVELELKPQTPFKVTKPAGDSFRCFVLDPKLTTTRYVNGVHVIPGNPEVVHHALIFSDPKGASRAKADADGGYDCFGGVGVDSANLVGAWAPGMVPLEHPANVGLQMDAGTLLVMQVHYHPHGDPAALAPDQTTFQMRFTSGVPEYSLVNALIGNFEKPEGSGDGLQPHPTDNGAPPQFVIPANARGHVETMKITVPPVIGNSATPNFYVYGVGGHMHYVGTDVKITTHHLVPYDDVPQDECLMHIPRWDFDWQRVYIYDTDIEKLPVVKPFDKIEVRCTYDNALSNPKVIRSISEQGLTSPRDVHLGESTLDEMCLGVFSLIYKGK